MTTLNATTRVLDLFAEPARVRLAALLAERELSVADLTAATALSQASVSTHLGKLRSAGVVKARKVGVSTLYSLLDEATMPAGTRKVWGLVRNEVHDAALDKDRLRLQSLLRARDKSAAWPDGVAGEMERHYSPGRTWESLGRGLIGLLDLGDVLDVGCGDGSIAELLAPRARSYTGVDRSERMIVAALRRLDGHKNVRCAVAAAEELAFPTSSFDVVLMLNVLTEVAEPALALNQATRVLRPGGRLLVTTLEAHEHDEVAAAYHHQHHGFAPAALKKLLVRASLEVESCAVTSRERRQPHFRVVTAYARKERS